MPASRFRLPWLIFCTLWVLLALGLGAVTGFDVYLHPFNQSPFYDRAWLLGFAIALFVMGLLAPVLRGRLLLAILLLATPALVGTGIITSGKGLTFLTLGWLVALAAMLGRRLMRLVNRDFAAGLPEKCVIYVSLGLAALIVPVCLAGACHALYPAPFRYGLLALTLLLIPENIRPARGLLAEAAAAFKRAWSGGGHLGLAAFALGVALLGILCSLAWDLAPAMQFDSLNYHLGIPQIYVRQHGFVPVPEEYREHWVFNGEMIYTLLLLLSGQTLAALLHLTMGILAGLMVFALARDLAGRRAGWLALIAFASIPEVTILAGWAFVELFVTAFAITCYYCFFRWWRGREDTWLILTGVFGGLALSSKLNALYMLAPLGGMVCFLLARRHGARAAFFKDLARFAAPLALLGTPWMIRNFLQTGNPVFPLMNGLFKSPLYTYMDHEQFYDRLGTGHGWRRLLLPWDLVQSTRLFGEALRDGALSCLPMFVIPWAYPLLRRKTRPAARLVAFFILAYLALWLSQGTHARFLMPILPLCAVLAALTLDGLWGRLRVRMTGFARHYCLFVILFFVSLPYLAAMRCVDMGIHYEDPQRYPLSLWTGRDTAESYLSRLHPSREALKFIDSQTSTPAKVLAVGMPFRFYSKSHIYGSSREFIGVTIDRELFKKLSAHQFDYLLLDKGRRETAQWNLAEVSNYVPLKFSKGNIYVFDLKAAGNTRGAVRINLLDNGGLEMATQKGDPADFARFGTPVADRTGKQAHTGKAAVRVDTANGYFQKVPVIAGETYTAGLWTRAERAGNAARLQINWLGKDGKYLTTSLTPVKAAMQWEYCQMTAKAPAGAAIAQFYINSHQAGAWVWVDDVLLAKGEMNGREWSVVPAPAGGSGNQ